MKSVLPTRAETVDLTRKLIDGRVTPAFAEDWAMRYVANLDAFESLEKSDPALAELINCLAIAAETHDGTNMMYTKESYQEWFDEYLKFSE